LAPAQAQYPAKPIRFILPFPPGGGTDTMGRAIGGRLGEALGQQVVIDNRGGGGANIGAELAAKSPPDGHTLFMATGTHTVNATLYRNLGYNLVKDFVPVTRLGGTAYVVVVHPSVPVKSVKELIAFAKARPGEISHSSSGTGSGPHLAGELFKSMTGTQMLHIPYKGGGPSVMALVSGEAVVGFTTTPSCIFQIQAGRLRGLAVSSAQRSPYLPKLPTVAEAGVPGYETTAWYGMMVPTGTPADIIARLNGETAKVLTLPDVKSRLDATGMVPQSSSPEELGRHVNDEIAKWAKVVKALGLRVD
jgi:tripartite-type tricarboxylate transporter receptor subunit TctC